MENTWDPVVDPDCWLMSTLQSNKWQFNPKYAGIAGQSKLRREKKSIVVISSDNSVHCRKKSKLNVFFLHYGGD